LAPGATQRRITALLRRAVGDLFLGPYWLCSSNGKLAGELDQQKRAPAVKISPRLVAAIRPCSQHATKYGASSDSETLSTARFVDNSGTHSDLQVKTCRSDAPIQLEFRPLKTPGEVAPPKFLVSKKMSAKLDYCMDVNKRVGARTMTEDSDEAKVDPGLVAEIVSSYVGKNSIAVDQLGALIATVHHTLSDLGKTPSATAPAVEKLTPAVPIRRSVQPDYVVCLECGFRGKTLRRHLRTHHGLEVAHYRARWKLPTDHPMTAPVYSENRSAMAKKLGLGRQRTAGETVSPTSRL
jgi:predicted transcriptional regulator